jgi:hypothetical protein
MRPAMGIANMDIAHLRLMGKLLYCNNLYATSGVFASGGERRPRNKH